ncbi:hypothetical protein Q3O97_05895 [Ralstonia pseudosolanacearum]|uniref:hypothetical protein n=1 Tax=Ralstonia pseudosolanacearum TaxID=1310165 RepID=UPI002710FD7F|nr:hypothetical protein [Ralstonia pseudosolanacearum]MDO3615371.1 hypothetical protein [Ralstonia pseudosolanacearum]
MPEIEVLEMSRIGIGPAIVIFAVVANVLFAVPLSIVAPIAAAAMCLAAAAICRDLNMLRPGAAIVVVATSKLMFQFLSSRSGQGQIPDWLQTAAAVLTSDGVVIFTSVLVFVSAMILGISSPMRNLPKASDLRDDDLR